MSPRHRHQTGEEIRAWFHSYSGGRTATAREGLGQEEEPALYQERRDGRERVRARGRNGLGVRVWAWTSCVRRWPVDVDVGPVSDVRIEERGPVGAGDRV